MIFLRNLTGLHSGEIVNLIDECGYFFSLDNRLKQNLLELHKASVNGVATGEFRVHTYTLYVLVRAVKPDLFIETGVANGKSSLVILKAMDENKKGNLISIDYPTLINGKDVHKPNSKDVGWLVPDSLRNRWKLMIGNSDNVLMMLQDKYLESVDIFMHDSLSVYDNMMLEYLLAKKLLKKGGLLLSDDIEGSQAFEDFTKQFATSKLTFGTLGAAVLV